MTFDAVIFDLDDTLYRERRYVLSGFAAVASDLHDRYGVGRADVFRTLLAALRRGRRAEALQLMSARFGLDRAELPQLVQLMRAHEPRLRLSPTARRLLRARHCGGRFQAPFKVGVLTNGRPPVQARKVRALGIEPLVDAVVYAAEHGTGAGKPEAAAFLAVCARLGVPPRHCVFVGNDPECDVAGARAVGMRTIRVGRRVLPAGTADADVHVTALAHVPSALARLATGFAPLHITPRYPNRIADAA